MELVDPPGRGRIFEREILPGVADATPTGRARLDAIARWLQDTAHLDILDSGLAGKGAWVVRRMRMRVEAFPRFEERLRVRTFCSAAAALVAERRTTVEREGGGRVEAVALWVHLDPESRLPARLDEGFQSVYGESAGGRRARSRLLHPPPSAGAERSSWRFRAVDLDVAGHVNNAAYWEPVEERLIGGPEPGPLDLEIEFREPAQAGDVTLLSAGDALWVAGERDAVHASIVGLPG